tara:strand:- start:960 stop:4010 length:3051 start_codon:yes stop_codon:yes gene_type:complete
MKKTYYILLLFGSINYGQNVEQIKKAKDIIQRSGMSSQQVRDEAKARGYSDKQIDKVIQKSESLEVGNKQSTPHSIDNVVVEPINSNKTIDYEMEHNRKDIVDNSKLVDIQTDDVVIKDESQLNIDTESQLMHQDERYFGYDIFSRDPSLFQASSVGIVDPDYLIGPGDEIIVMLWGETQFRQLLKVDREGFVFIPEIGQVFVNGLNLNLLESKLFRVFSQSYASLNPQDRTPTTFLDVSLGNLRPLRIQVLGEVAQPGAYTISPSATLFSALYYFNGPKIDGSLRDIQLIRSGEKIASIDFYDYLLTGKKPEDQKLQLDDVIFIPRRLKTVAISGEINRNGIYELKFDEDLADLIKMAGNLKVTAYLDRCQIDRIVPFEDRVDLGMDRMYNDVNLNEVLKSQNSFPLYDGDRIQIFSVLDGRQNIVELRGAVTRPGNYDLGDSLKVSELINKADGFLGDAYLERVDIVRMNKDFSEQLIKLNLSDIQNGNINNDIKLQSLDKIRVYGLTEMISKKHVSINGYVKQPGSYPLQKSMTLYDLIFKAGGFIDVEYRKRAYLERADLVRIKEDSDEKEIISFHLGKVLDKEGLATMPLRHEDVVQIYSADQIKGSTPYVSISGHVKRSGEYELYEDNMRIYDLLFKAGGFDDPIYKSKTFLERADLIRFDNDQINQSITSFHLGDVLSDKNHKSNFALLPGDKIRIYPRTIFNVVQNISINGAVRRPGTYELKTNMTLLDLILEAGGVDNNIHRYRIEIARINPLNKELENYAKIITFNVNSKLEVLYNDEPGIDLNKIPSDFSSFILKPFDLVSIRPDPYFTSQRKIIMQGEILYPGQYTILNSNEKITDIIRRAGGLLPNAYPEASEYTRNGEKINVSFNKILKNKNSKLNFNVQDGDLIKIVPHPNIVRISGEVNSSGVHKFVPGKRLRYYIKLAGGMKPDADLNNIWIEYPNGDSKKYNRWSLISAKVIDGSSIYIGKEKEQEPFDKTEFAKEVTAILANLAQTVAVVALAARSN